jgi:hypothetical protein
MRILCIQETAPGEMHPALRHGRLESDKQLQIARCSQRTARRHSSAELGGFGHSPTELRAFRQRRTHAQAPVWRGEPYEIKSPLILQPGPAALTDGLDALHAIVARWAVRKSALR